MPRTVVPPVRFRSTRSTRSPRSTRGAEPAGGDSLPERLVKYVPAETLAFFVPIAAVLDDGNRRPWLITVLVVGVIGTAGYLWLAARKAGDDERPLPHFYVLACVAFVCWAIGTSAGVADLIGLRGWRQFGRSGQERAPLRRSCREVA